MVGEIDASNFPDYVFKSDYNLQVLTDLEKEIQQLGHLPDIPTAEEVEKEGLQPGNLSIKLLENIEELTLYVIDLHKQIESMEKIIGSQN